MHVCIHLINQSNCSISVHLLFLFCSCVFISRSYKNRSIFWCYCYCVWGRGGGGGQGSQGRPYGWNCGVVFFLMGNLSLILSYGHSPQPYHCVFPLQIVVKSCSVHLKWISTYLRLGMTKYSNLSEITPQASTPMDWKRSIALKGIINEACSQTIYINTLFIDS